MRDSQDSLNLSVPRSIFKSLRESSRISSRDLEISSHVVRFAWDNAQKIATSHFQRGVTARGSEKQAFSLSLSLDARNVSLGKRPIKRSSFRDTVASMRPYDPRIK